LTANPVTGCSRRNSLGHFTVDTGDARSLPYADDSFDVVVSHWVVHNIENADDRTQVLKEMTPLTKPSGQLLLVDIDHHDERTLPHLALSQSLPFCVAVYIRRRIPSS